MKKNMILLLLLFVAVAAFSVPAKRGLWRTLTLADGTEVRAQLMGDEHVHYWMTADGQQLVANGNHFSAVNSEQIAARTMKRRAVKSSSRRDLRRVNIGDKTSYTGTKKGLVILANFKDVTFKTANNLAKYKKILNEAGYTSSEGFKGSVGDYFKAQSRGIFELDFDVVGPITLSQNRTYYGGNDSDGNDANPTDMIIEACKAVDSQVNFKDYDWDGDGEADQVFVLYAGTGEADSYDDDAIWPHMWELSSDGKTLTLDNVKIDTYACSNEITMLGKIEGIGVFCHEFSHCMGFPDFYDVAYNGWFGLNEFDLMDQGSYNGNGFVPAGYSGYEKMMAGWQEPIVLGAEDVTVENLTAISEGGASYILYNDGHTDEFYMIENRQQTGWDAGLPAAGLMITHVDFDKTIWEQNTPNTKVTSSDVRTYGYAKTNDHQRMTIFHADNDDDSNYWSSYSGAYSKQTLSGDLYPYGGNNSLTATSRPAATLYNANSQGKKTMQGAITEITKNSDGTVSFVFTADGNTSTTEPETPTPDGALFYESFNGCAGTGGNDGSWSGNIASSSIAYDNDGWEAQKAYAAYKCAKFGTGNVAGQATTPAIAVSGDVTLSFMAGAWNASKDGTTLDLSVSNGTISPASITMDKGSWNTYTANISAEGDVKITFTQQTGRFFLDEVIVKSDATAITPLRATTRKTGGIYTLGGQLVGNDMQQLPKGLYIHNGKKVVKK